MDELLYVVECKSFLAFFEPIAAFNLEQAAVNYASKCKESCNPKFQYRVVNKSRTDALVYIPV